MTLRFAINGLGRIGRALLRISRQRQDLELVAVNDLGSAEQLAQLVAHDSVHGAYEGEVSAGADQLLLDGRQVPTFQEQGAERIPWQETSATVVVDATGRCKTRGGARKHLRGATVKKVLVSANAADLDLTICIGVNHREYSGHEHHLLSAASCTTNCLAPLVYLLQREFGLARGLLNTVHSYNNDQRLLDFPHTDPRRARAAAMNMIPTTTSAVEAVERVLPELTGKLQGYAVRVPTPNVSLLDLVVELERPASVQGINDTFRRAATGDLSRVLAITEENLVSSDFLRRSESAIVDLALTQAVGEKLIRVVAWYDNEWGHASRLADLLELIGGDGPE